MKKLTVLILCLFFVNILFAQEQQAIRISNPTTQKEFLFKEHKKIVVGTIDGKRLSGRFIIADNVITIANEKIELADIEYLKRSTILTPVLTTGLLVYGGILTTGFGVIIGAFVDTNGFLLTIPGAGMIYTGIKSPNFNKKFKTEKDWTFEIINLAE